MSDDEYRAVVFGTADDHSHAADLLGKLNERSPYETGVCPGCGERVEFQQLDVSQPGGPVEKVSGRWQCRTPGCKYGEPA